MTWCDDGTVILSWDFRRYGALGSGAVLEANPDGTDPHAIVTGQTLYAVAVGGSHIFWTDRSTVYEANLDGTSPHTIITSQNNPIGLAVGP